MGSLERVLENGGIADVQGARWRGEGSAQDRETFEVSMEREKARQNDFRTVVLHRGIQDRARFEFFTGKWGSPTAQSGRNGETRFSYFDIDDPIGTLMEVVYLAPAERAGFERMKRKEAS